VSRRRVDVTLGADGSAQVALDLTVSGVYASEWRQRYLAEDTRRERAARDLGSELGPVEIAAGKGGIEVNDLEDVEQPVKLRARGKAATMARREGENLSVPIGPSQRLVADYASLSTRTLDLVLPALTTREDEWTLKLPAGTKVVRGPEPSELDTPFGRFSIAVEQSPGKVTLKSTVAFKKVRIKPAEYPAWRAFCEKVDRAFGQRVVLGK